MLFAILCSHCWVANVHAKCTIELKDGRTIESRSCEETDTTLFYYKYGSKIGLTREKVANFSQTEIEEEKVGNDNSSFAPDKWGYRPQTTPQTKKDIETKYHLSIKAYSFRSFHVYVQTIRTKLSIEEQFLVVHEIERKCIEQLKSAQESYEKAVRRNNKNIDELKRKLLLTKKGLHFTESSIAHLIKYTESDPESTKFTDRYTPEQVQRYNDSEANFDRLKREIKELYSSR